MVPAFISETECVCAPCNHRDPLGLYFCACFSLFLAGGRSAIASLLHVHLAVKPDLISLAYLQFYLRHFILGPASN